MGVRGRTCLGCRRIRGKAELVRLVRSAEGEATVDVTGVAPGRGAYVCPGDECFERGRRRIAGALRGARVDGDALRRAFDAVRASRQTAGDDPRRGDG